MKTPIEELIETLNRKPLDWWQDSNVIRNMVIGEAEQLLTKEKEQREELIKEVCIKSYNEGYTQKSIEDLPKRSRDRFLDAEQYYNEVIKPKL